jgi:TonB family protein
LVANDKVERVGKNGVTAPRAEYTPDPDYSDEARKAKYQGVTVLDVVVDANGGIGKITLLRPLGMGLDERAAEKISTWRFKPAMKDGNPVAVEMNVEVSFNLY